MGGTLEQVMTSLPKERQEKINKEAGRFIQCLQMVREIQDVTQADIARAVGGDLLPNESAFIR